MFEKEIFDFNHSKAIIIPKSWAEDKSKIGIILFDLMKKDERKRFFETKERIIEESENTRSDT